jgi:ubiquinone biosynthesis accessory factor UbiJ
MIDRGAVAGLNHLLAQQPWAAERLAAFGGQSVRFRCRPFPDLCIRILGNGLLDRASADGAADLTVTLRPAALPLLLARDEGALKQVEIEGSAELASAVQYLFGHLAWDAEEDLSRLLGDVVAHRLVSEGRAFAAWQRDAAARLGQNLAEYWTEEQPLLARPSDLENFCRDVDALRDDTARLEKRIERLERAGEH